MKIPISWLNDYVDVSDLSVKELADKLIFSGIEVEGIDTDGPVLDEHFVVGEVLTCEAHPNSDHLHVCTVSDGSETPLQIVCGAPNCRAGLKTALATIGAVVPDGGFVIKPAKLRGVPSKGMLCSASELKISSDHDGIMELPADLVPGTKLADINSLFPAPETVMDLEITWNRSDCFSLIGIAREFSALLGRPLKMPAVDFEETGAPVETLAKVSVESPNCPRYTARVLTGVQDGPSPDWMVKRLEQCDVRSLGLIVDVTNYVMLECGQPLHAFDHTRLADQTIIVRQARDGEILKTLDGVDRKLKESMLVIADRDRPVALAGVMGGEESGVEEGATRTVLVESALFAPPCIKHTATDLAMRSEASYRFERGVDRDLADWASRRAVSLLVKYGGGTVAKGVIDVDNRPEPPAPVVLNHERARNLIGIDLPVETMRSILVSLGLKVVSEAEDSTSFEIPSWRLDLLEEADLVEEISRIYGLDKLPDVQPSAIAVPGADDAPFRAEAACREAVSKMGFYEGMSYSFLSAAELDNINPDASHRLVIPNPVSNEYGVLRDSLLPQLVSALGRNHARQVTAPALFEIGRVFCRDAKGNPAEEKRIALGFCGPFGRGPMDLRRPVSDEEAMLLLKGAIESLCADLHAPTPRFALEDFPAFEKGWSVVIRIGKDVAGRFGLIRQQLRHPWRLHSPMAVGEIQLKALLQNVGSRHALKPVPAYPAVTRDLALVAPAGLTNGEIVQAIKKAAPKTLTDVALFDIFVQNKSGDGARSLAYSLVFRSQERTLTDEEVNAAFQKIIANVTKTLGVEVRAN